MLSVPRLRHASHLSGTSGRERDPTAPHPTPLHTLDSPAQRELGLPPDNERALRLNETQLVVTVPEGCKPGDSFDVRMELGACARRACDMHRVARGVVVAPSGVCMPCPCATLVWQARPSRSWCPRSSCRAKCWRCAPCIYVPCRPKCLQCTLRPAPRALRPAPCAPRPAACAPRLAPRALRPSSSPRCTPSGCGRYGFCPALLCPALRHPGHCLARAQGDTALLYVLFI